MLIILIANIMGRKFTDKEDKYLKDNYLTVPAKRMSKALGRTEGTARQRMKILGIVVPSEIIEIFRSDSRFKKGSISFNKGKKQYEYMSKAAINRTKATRFKKGGLPATTLYDGCITTRIDTKSGRPYKYIRINKSEWLPLHVYKWQNKNGKVPTGMCVSFRDKNSMNVSLKNLELITRAENVKRNSGSVNLADGNVALYLVGKNHMHLYEDVLKDKKLIEAKRQQLLLKRTINERATNSG